jgi:hypothetical protein
MLGIVENVLRSFASAQSLRFRWREPIPYTDAPQSSSKGAGVKSSGSKHVPQPPNFAQQFFENFVPIRSVLCDEPGKIEIH